MWLRLTKAPPTFICFRLSFLKIGGCETGLVLDFPFSWRDLENVTCLLAVLHRSLNREGMVAFISKPGPEVCGIFGVGVCVWVTSVGVELVGQPLSHWNESLGDRKYSGGEDDRGLCVKTKIRFGDRERCDSRGRVVETNVVKMSRGKFGAKISRGRTEVCRCGWSDAALARRVFQKACPSSLAVHMKCTWRRQGISMAFRAAVQLKVGREVAKFFLPLLSLGVLIRASLGPVLSAQSPPSLWLSSSTVTHSTNQQQLSLSKRMWGCCTPPARMPCVFELLRAKSSEDKERHREVWYHSVHSSVTFG